MDKLEPESFSLWMRILRRVPGSILWLLDASAADSEVGIKYCSLSSTPNIVKSVRGLGWDREEPDYNILSHLTRYWFLFLCLRDVGSPCGFEDSRRDSHKHVSRVWKTKNVHVLCAEKIFIFEPFQRFIYCLYFEKVSPTTINRAVSRQVLTTIISSWVGVNRILAKVRWVDCWSQLTIDLS